MPILYKSAFLILVSAEKCIEFEHGTDRNAVYDAIGPPYETNDPSYWHFG